MRRFVLPAALLLLGACITVTEQETKSIDARRLAQERWERLFRSQEVGALQVRSLVYKPAALPLSDFLKKLARGDYKTALEDMLGRFDGDVYNAMRKTTYLDYGNLLWSAPTLAPGARTRGLLFFKVEDSDRAALRLEAELADQI